MARIKQGFLGNASGKLGNVVFSKWRNLETARQYQPEIQDANTPEQQKQRTRMVNLLQFLKPLNKTFIKFFNTSISKGSTPWAVAIKDNMKGVSPDGIFSFQNLKLGAPTYPPFTLVESFYNPFIDQFQVKYKGLSNYKPKEPFPYIGCAALGKYSADNNNHNFDTRHQLCFLPMGNFFSSFYDDFRDQVNYNWWANGMLWVMYFSRNDAGSYNNPNLNLTEPIYFKPVSVVEGFDTDIEENPVPLEALTWEYIQDTGKWYIVFKIDYTKTSLVQPIDYTIIFLGVGLYNNQYMHTPAYEWNLGTDTKKFEIGVDGYHGSAIGLFSVYKNNGVRVSRFNRFYIGRGTDNVDYPYFDQIFKSNYSFPASFNLSDNQCGFCGYIDELLNDFIQLYQQGIIQYNVEPVITIEYALLLSDSVNGTVTVKNNFRNEDKNYFFLVGDKAQLIPQAATGFVFSKWAGADAADVKLLEIGTYELLMDKNRNVYAEYVEIPVPVTQHSLTVLNSVNGSINVTNYLSKAENVYILTNGANALLSPQPEPGFVFSGWAGPDAADVLLTEPNNYTLLMNKDRVIFAQFMPV